MNINILRYSLFGIAGGQEVDRNFLKVYYLPSYNDCIMLMEFVLISLIEPDVRKTLKINFSGFEITS